MKKYLKLIILPALVLISAIIILITNVPRLEYQYNDYYKGYIVTKAIGNAQYYEIKDTYKNKPVVGIGENAFSEHRNLKEIKLPETIELIARRAFFDCNNLTTINLENVIEIERNAFSYCSSLTSLNIGADNIGASAFYKCISLKEVNLENTVIVSDMAFAQTSFEKISIPSSCKTFGTDVFYECVMLKTINVYGSNLKNNKYLNSLNIVNYIEKE